MTTARYVGAVCAIALVAAGGACESRGLVLRLDAAVRDGLPSVEVAPISQVPVAGQCGEGYSPCGSGDGLRCYDLGRSQEHCGACGNACASGIGCELGTCRQTGCKGALGFKTVVFGSSGIIIALGDFDGDGILDLVGASDDASPMSLFYGAGDGTFSAGQVIDDGRDSMPPDSGVPLMPIRSGWQARAADLDGDGHLDLTSIAGGDSAVTVRLGSGSRGAPFGAPTRYPTSGAPLTVMLADFDADGRLDLLAGVSKAFEYWRGQGDGRFVQGAPLVLRDVGGWGPGIATVTDWNDDGVLDLVYTYGGFSGMWGGPVLGAVGQLSYRLGRGDGSFEPEVACGLAMGVVGDLDHDHRPDLISASSIMGASLLLGITGCSASAVVPITDWTKQGGVAFADLNGDGNLDVVIDDNLAVMVHVGDGKGGFPHALTLPAPTFGQWPLGSFLVGDLNRDGKLDVVFAREGGWGVFLNTCQ